MATNKNAIIRYQTLDKCFGNRNKRYHINDLVQACNDALFQYNLNATGVKRRQIYDDINFMKSDQGYKIDLEIIKDGRTAYYRYRNPMFSINNQPINQTEIEQLKEALLTLHRIKGMPQFEWVEEMIIKFSNHFKFQTNTKEIIGFENNPYLKGMEFLTPLYNAINHQKVIVISYQTFKKNVVEDISMHPQYLKQYNNRWFVLGTHSKYQPITTLAIDRIVSIRESQDDYEDASIDFNEFYEDVIGVTRNQKLEVMTITFYATAELAKYLLTKPLHGSQKNKTNNVKGLVFTVDVVPNYELEEQILSFGEALKVIDPPVFVHKIKTRLEKNLAQYL